MEQKQKIYCGDNEELPEGYSSHGTPYQCLRKGVGVGLHLPLKNRRYRPKKEGKKFYCGNKKELPQEYVSFGTRQQCLRKGVGVGLHLQQQRQPIEQKQLIEQKQPIEEKKYQSPQEIAEEMRRLEQKEVPSIPLTDFLEQKEPSISEEEPSILEQKEPLSLEEEQASVSEEKKDLPEHSPLFHKSLHFFLNHADPIITENQDIQEVDKLFQRMAQYYVFSKMTGQE